MKKLKKLLVLSLLFLCSAALGRFSVVIVNDAMHDVKIYSNAGTFYGGYGGGDISEFTLKKGEVHCFSHESKPKIQYQRQKITQWTWPEIILYDGINMYNDTIIIRIKPDTGYALWQVKENALENISYTGTAWLIKEIKFKKALKKTIEKLCNDIENLQDLKPKVDYQEIPGFLETFNLKYKKILSGPVPFYNTRELVEKYSKSK